VQSPLTRYAKCGDIHIAYQVIGEGPGDLVYVPSALGHVETYWEDPATAAYLLGLSSFSRLILLDKRGTGMSDRVVGAPTMEERIDDVRAVMAAAGSTRAALYGSSEGGAIGALFAATYPDAVSHLVIMGSGAVGFVTPAEAELLILKLETLWGTGDVIEVTAPSVAHDGAIRAHIGLRERRSGTPTSMAALIRMNSSFDVRPSLSSISAPTLILHRTGDQRYSLDQAREMADGIPGARFVELEGTDHLPYYEEPERILGLIEEFVTGRRPTRAEKRTAPRPCQLTARELEVLELIATGKTNRQIANELFISPDTVSHHLRHIFTKTSSTNRTEASAYAHRNGLIPASANYKKMQ
jgi:pimeloyl-ACP methyl ester carboxylesterase/DNA-binding CsgD family transcriptional regulator